MSDRPVRTRIAPSPTGDPHVGTAYMGLVNLVVARQGGGQFLLRIDDTDRTRYRAGSEEAIFEALRWLGLTWDEGPDVGGPKGPYRQSERTALYREHADLFVARGAGYRCFCSKERLDALRDEQRARKETPRYDGRCRDADPAEGARRAAAGEPHVVRLRVPTDGTTTVRDLLRGDVTFPHADLQDQVLVKEDGFPTYHFASCVDDHLMEITHIIRAEEWLTSAPLHALIFAGFGWELPVLCHMPLLRNADKSKISKRKNPTSLLYYRDAGFLPEGLLNFLGLMGWGGPKDGEGGASREVFTLDDMVRHFRLAELALGGPVFDPAKLRHINAAHLRALPARTFAARALAFLADESRLEALAPLVLPRMETFGQLAQVADFFLGDVTQRPDLLVPARKTPPEQAAAAEEAWFALGDALEVLERVDPWTAANLDQACRGLGDAAPAGWKPKDVFMALRAAISGKTATPPLWESMELLGKSRTLGRLGDARRALPEPSKKAQERREKARRAPPAAPAGAGGPTGAPTPAGAGEA